MSGVKFRAATAEEILAEIQSARAVLGMRLHALIFATASAIPSAAISYDPKIDALMAYLSLSENALSMDAPDADEIAVVLRRILTDAEIPGRLRARAAALCALAEEDLDRAAALMRDRNRG